MELLNTTDKNVQCIYINAIITIGKFNINIGIIESSNEIYCHQLVQKNVDI